MKHPESQLLSAHLDGELPPREAGELEAHLADCPACSGLFRELSEVQRRARSLQDRVPQRDLWPGIAGAIRGEGDAHAQVIQLHPWRDRHAEREVRRGLRVSYPQAIAAGLALALFSGAMEAAQLEALLAQHRDGMDPETARILEKNLGIIDRAIQESVKALQSDPGNSFLESHLARSVETKASYLREAMVFVAVES